MRESRTVPNTWNAFYSALVKGVPNECWRFMNHGYSSYEAERAEYYDFVVSTTRYDLDLESYPDAEIVYRIERGGGLLAVIKGR